MPRGLNTLDAGPGAKGNLIAEKIVYFDNPNSVITLHPFTITNVNSTPTIQHVGDRPAVGLAGAGAGTDGNNFMLGVAAVRPQAGLDIEWFWTARSADWTNHEFACGLAPVGTGITAAINGGTEPTDELVVFKDNADTRFSTKARKASGTEELSPVARMDTLTNDTWYRGHAVVTRDASTAGKGRFRLYWGADSLMQLPLVQEQYIATQFPDTVSMAFFIGWLAGGAVTTQMNWGMFGYRIYSRKG